MPLPFGFLSKVGLIYEITSCIVFNHYSKIDSRMGLNVWHFCMFNCCFVDVVLTHVLCFNGFILKIMCWGFPTHVRNTIYLPSVCHVILHPCFIGPLHVWMHGVHSPFFAPLQTISHQQNIANYQHFLSHHQKTNDQNSRRFSGFKLGGFEKALLQNPREMIRGRIFSEMIRISARKSELQAKSRSYRPKVRVTAGQTPKIRTESPGKAPESGLGASTENPP